MRAKKSKEDKLRKPYSVITHIDAHNREEPQ